MKLIEEIIETLPDSPIEDVRVGPFWSALKSKNCGLALTYREPYRMLVRYAGDLIGKSAKGIASAFANSWNPTEAAIGIAAINSLIEPDGEHINALDYIKEVSLNKKVTFVGHFPRMDEIRSRAKSLSIIEKEHLQIGDYPDVAAEFIIPESDIVVITGSSFVNKSYKRLLELSKNCFTILIGPSTIMSDIIFDYGVDVLAGSRIIDCNKILNIVSQGGHLRDFSKFLDYVMKFRRKI
jgi:uncharacterized protein (DUF4213/DUF364 family)